MKTNVSVGTLLRAAAVSFALVPSAALADPPGYLFQDFDQQPVATATPATTVGSGSAQAPARRNDGRVELAPGPSTSGANSVADRLCLLSGATRASQTADEPSKND
jgi:hypothetical protein